MFDKDLLCTPKSSCGARSDFLEVIKMAVNELEFLEMLLKDEKESKKWVIPDWLETINKMGELEEFMKINFSEDSPEKIMAVAENMQQALKGGGCRYKKGLVFFNGKENFPIKREF